MTLALALTASIIGTFTGANDIADLEQKFGVREKITLADGVGANQADIVFADQRTLAASATENLDLAGGLTDAFGAPVTFAEIVAIFVKAASGNTNDVVIGGAGSNTFVGPFADATDKIKVKPGGMLLIAGPNAAGLGAVTAGTGDILLVANSAGSTSVTYDIIIIGRSA